MSSTASQSGLVSAVLGGVLAYVLGYVVTYAATIAAVRDSALARVTETFSDGGSAWKIVGWIFYNAHNATTTINVDVPIFGGTSAVNLIARSDGLSPGLYLIPVVLLVAAGLVAALASNAGDLRDGAVTGAAITIGYLPLAAVGAFLFAITVGSSSGRPDLVTAVGIAGVLYPLVFGTIGGAAGALLGDRT